MVSPNSLISYETAWAKIGTLSSLAPHPTTTKIHVLNTYLRKVMVKSPSFQSLNHGYQSMVDAAEMYALSGEVAWINVTDPGFHCQTDGTLNTVTQCDANTIFSADIIICTSQHSVKAAVTNTLNESVAKVYRRDPTGIGARDVCPNDNPQEIIDTLTMCYGQKTTANDNAQDDSWHLD